MRRVPESGVHERIIGLYEDNAEAWDRQRGRDLHEAPWLDRFMALLPAGARVLDIGCGGGEPIAAYLIERGFGVTGIDSSPSLVGLCRRRFPDQEWHVGDMRRLELGRRFDGLVAWHSFFHLAANDQQAMFARFAAHAAPGAALMFTSGPAAGAAIGQWQGEPLHHASLAPDEYQALLTAHGFRLLERRLRDPECGDATVWLAQKA
jgi:trans-aconitate methyltransferase